MVSDKRRLVSIEKVDKNLDGRIDGIKTIFADESLNKYIIFNSIDKNYDGNLDHQYPQIIPLQQNNFLEEDFTCERMHKVTNFMKHLSQEVEKIILAQNGDYLVTDFGFKIHRGCLKKFGQNFLVKQIKNSLQTGLQCLAKLEEKLQKNLPKNKKIGAPMRNAIKIQTLLKKSPVSLVCDSHKKFELKTKAFASAHENSIAQIDKKTFVKHPYIVLNPKFSKTGPDEIDAHSLRQTLFHEHLHNIGHRHGATMEAPYACEDCCFSSNAKAARKKELACRICTGDYSSFLEKKYIEDLLEWSKLAGHTSIVSLTIKNYLNAFPKSTWGIIKVIQATIAIDPFAIALGQIAINEFKGLTKEEKAAIKATQKYANFAVIKRYSLYSKIAASAFYENRFSHDPKKSMEILELSTATLFQLKNKLTNPKEKLSSIDKEFINILLKNIKSTLNEISEKARGNQLGRYRDFNLYVRSHELFLKLKTSP